MPLTGRTADLVTREARIGPYGMGGTSLPSLHDPTHERAYRIVEHQAEDWAEVRIHDAPGNGPRPLAFRAWRVSATSFAWQTPVMPAPAFATYAPHDALVTDQYGTFCPSCHVPVKATVPA